MTILFTWSGRINRKPYIIFIGILLLIQIGFIIAEPVPPQVFDLNIPDTFTMEEIENSPEFEINSDNEIITQFVFRSDTEIDELNTAYFKKHKTYIMIQYIILIPLMYPQFCMASKRFHDLNKKAWNVLWLIVPLVSLGFQIYLMSQEGDAQSNKYGDPQIVLSDVQISLEKDL